MPDVFAGIGILTTASLLAAYGPLAWTGYLTAFVLLSGGGGGGGGAFLLVGTIEDGARRSNPQRGPDGVFASAQPEMRRRLSAEEMRFVLAVLAHDPWGELAATLRSVGSLLTTLRTLRVPVLSGIQRGLRGQSSSRALSAHARHRRLPRHDAHRGARRAQPGDAADGGGGDRSRAAWRQTRVSLDPAVMRITAWMAAGLLANAAICGAVSGVYPRLGVRIAWLIPFAALLIAAALVAPPRRSAAPPARHTAWPSAHHPGLDPRLTRR